jgi:hypothetical protein
MLVAGVLSGCQKFGLARNPRQAITVYTPPFFSDRRYMGQSCGPQFYNGQNVIVRQGALP